MPTVMARLRDAHGGAWGADGRDVECCRRAQDARRREQGDQRLLEAVLLSLGGDLSGQGLGGGAGAAEALFAPIHSLHLPGEYMEV